MDFEICSLPHPPVPPGPDSAVGSNVTPFHHSKNEFPSTRPEWSFVNESVILVLYGFGPLVILSLNTNSCIQYV